MGPRGAAGIGWTGSHDKGTGGPALSRRAAVRLLVVLAAAAGCLDVFCVTQLGGFFASVITGNLVQSGNALVTTDPRLLAGGAVAVGGYAIGVVGGTLPLRHAGPGWRGGAEAVTAAEAVLLIGVAAGWWASDGRPGYAAALTLLLAAAAASGLQSVVTIAAGIRDASTTYLTGSLTTVVRGVVLDPHRFAAGAGAVVRLLGLLTGAVLGAVVLRFAPLWAPAVAAALVTGVLASATLRRRTAERQGG